MMRLPRTSSAVSGLAIAVLGAIACSGDTLPYAGGLMLSIQTDLAAPKDISAIGLSITSDGRPVFADTRDVAPNGEVRFPATIAVIGDADRPRAIIKIRAIAFKDNGDVRVLRDIVTTVPKARTALLRVPLLWINEGSGTGKRQDLVASISPRDTAPEGFTRIVSACPDGQTFLEGECADATVDSSTLPDYQEKDVFGGGTANGTGGRCFDVLGCFAGAASVTIDASACSAALAGVDPNDPNLSFAVSLPASAATGECKDGTCLVPLDKGAGWRPAASGVTFPRALCSRIASGLALGIVRTTACPAKALDTPSCGPASSVTTSSSGGADGGIGTASLDFDPPLSLSGEPNLSSVAIDADNVYLARTAPNPVPPGVVKIARADVLAQTTPPPTTVLFGYGAPQLSSMFVGSQPTRIAVRGEAGEVRVCTPTSANDCPSFTVNGPPTLAVSPTDAYVTGTTGGEPTLFSINLQTPALVPRAITGPEPIASLAHVDGTLYFGMVGGSIRRCTAPCVDQSGITELRPAPPAPAIVTAIAADPRVAGKLFFMQIPADGMTAAAGGIFEIGTSGTGEVALATGAEILGAGPPPLVPPGALAVDAEYVYWGGNFDDPRGGGKKSGLLRKNHVTRAASEAFLEDALGTDRPTAIAVDGTHVFWSFNRADRALFFARKKRTF